MINRISNEVKENKNMFKSIKGLNKVNYLILLPEKQDTYYNEEINKAFDKWNKKYGNFVLIDEENTNKNNLRAIANEVKYDLNRIEPDDEKIINSLVTFLYKKQSTRKKRLLWYLYGDKLYENISNNISTLKPNVCWKCGTRTVEDLRDHKCRKCCLEKNKSDRQKYKNKKQIKCIDCGKLEYVSIYSSRSNRCKACYEKHRRMTYAVSKRNTRGSICQNL